MPDASLLFVVTLIVSVSPSMIDEKAVKPLVSLLLTFASHVCVFPLYVFTSSLKIPVIGVFSSASFIFEIV